MSLTNKYFPLSIQWTRPYFNPSNLQTQSSYASQRNWIPEATGCTVSQAGPLPPNHPNSERRNSSSFCGLAALVSKRVAPSARANSTSSGRLEVE
jgi:hypothetical protein